MKITPREYYSLSNVADLLGKPSNIINGMVLDGTLKPAYQKEGSHFFDLKSLAQFDIIQQMINSTWHEDERIVPVRSLKTVELFAGGGGLSLGLEKAGCEAVLLNDVIADCCDTLKLNRPNWNVQHGDIAGIEFKEYRNNVDMVVGGFPLQTFSAPDSKRGLEDIRGTLFFEYARAIKEIQPYFFLAENVKDLKLHDKGKTYRVIKAILEDMEYTLVNDDVYRCMLFKVPQKRERVILFGVRNDIRDKLQHSGLNIFDLYRAPSIFPDIVNFGDVMKKGAYYKTDVLLSNDIKYPAERERFFKMIPEGGNWKDLPTEELRRECLGHVKELSGGMTGYARRLDWHSPALTIGGNPIQKKTERCHPKEIRPLTVSETARLQTFPDEWKFSGKISSQYKQIGNAVPVEFAAAIGRSITRLSNQLVKLNVI